MASLHYSEPPCIGNISIRILHLCVEGTAPCLVCNLGGWTLFGGERGGGVKGVDCVIAVKVIQGRPPFLAHAMQKVSIIVGLMALRLAFNMG